MQTERILFTLGGVEIVFGGAVTAWPDAAPQIIGVTVMAVGFATIAYGIFGWEKGLPVHWLPSMRFTSPRGGFGVRRLLRLSDAAKLAYEKTSGSTAAFFAERPISNETPDPKRWYVHALLGKQQNSITVYGRKPQLSKLMVIPATEFASLNFSDDLNSVHEHGQAYPKYVDLFVPAKELHKRIEEIEKW